ncbi:MAG: CRTAC1 family protein [Anaerolineae bacterium]
MNRRKFGATIVVFGILALCLVAAHQARASGEGQLAPPDLPPFTNVTESAGVTATLNTWGASWGDYNNDGFPDLLTYSHERLPELYHNNGDGTLTDIVASTPLSVSLDRHFAAWGDYDNDGDQDVVISVGGQAGTSYHEMELYRNDGGGGLVNVAGEAGVSDGYARGRSVSWADYDRDGDLDFFAANHIREEAPNRLWRNNGNGTFTDVAAEAGVADSLGLNFGSFEDYDRDGWPDIFVLGISQNLLYHNNGDGTFEDVSQITGFADAAGDSYTWGDYDGDGDADLFIGDAGNSAADTVEGEGGQVRFFGVTSGGQDGLDLEVAGDQLTFELELRGPDDCTTRACIHIGGDSHPPATHPFTVGLEAVGTPVYTPGVSSGYYIWRDDGTDLWHVRMSHPVYFKYGGIVTASSPFSSFVPINLEPPPPLGEAMLWHNKGDGTFSEVSAEAGVDVPGNYRAANWVDSDNDGWLDLFVADKGNLAIGNPPNHLFRNNGDGTFQDVAALVGVEGTTEGGANVSAWADFDRDGFLDLFTQNGGFAGLWPFNEGGPNQLFRNQGNANHWLQLELVGMVSNRSGLGAVVRLSAGGRTQVQTHTDGVDAYSQNGDSLHFGLGGSTVVDSIVIDWPSGIHQVLTDVPVDQQLTVIEPPYMIFLPLIEMRY